MNKEIAATAGIAQKRPMNEKRNLEKATFGAGCFWCVEPVYGRIQGIESVTSGYMGGSKKNPSYEEICSGSTGHAEVVQLEFDPQIVAYDELLALFWRLHDPTTLNRQGADVGTQYRSVIFHHSEQQRMAAQISKREAAGKFSDPIVTEITSASEFYEAEECHQDYYERNPYSGYCQFVIAPKLKKLGLR